MKSSKKKIAIIVIATLLFQHMCLSQQPVYFHTSSSLYKININTCEVDYIGFFNGDGYSCYDIAFTTDGRLWGTNGYDELYQIDTTNAQCTLVHNIDRFGNALEGLNDTTLMLVHGDRLYSIDVNTGASNLMGSVGYGSSGDLTWNNDNLYMTSHDLIKISIDKDNLSVNNYIKYYSESEPLSGYGMASSISDSMDNLLLSFHEKDLYQICSIDGGAELICSNISNFIINDAASHLTPIQPSPQLYCKRYNNQKMEAIFINVNYFSDALVIHSDEELNDADIKIYNSIGQLVFSRLGFTGNEISISTQKLLHGLYIINITESIGRTKTKKLILK